MSKPTRPSFEDRCYKLLKSVPRGKVTTYSSLASALNSRAYRAVGNAMAKNLDGNVPCHRVVHSNGDVGNYNRGKSLKIRILKAEGVPVINGKIDLSRYFHDLNKRNATKPQ